MGFRLGPHQTLTESSNIWTFDDCQDSKKFESDMIDFMLDHKGIGLAANQVGIAKNVFVMGSVNIDGFSPIGVFNPKILEYSRENEFFKEGCLSYPELWLNIKRPKEILVEYQDWQGSVHTAKITGLISRIFQHEYDHLNGICFVDKVSRMKLNLALRKLRKK